MVKGEDIDLVQIYFYIFLQFLLLLLLFDCF